MITPVYIKQYLQELAPDLKIVSDKVMQTLFSFCEKHHFAYTQRTKTAESLYDKLESGRYNSLDDIDDLIASTIIIANLKQEKDVIDFLNQSFKITTIKKRNSTKKSPEVFRFDSTRVICTLNNFAESTEQIYKFKFEIQILSAFEHAWQITTHSLSYKSPLIDWKVFRLSSQLRASVEQLDTLCSSYSEISENILESEWPEIQIKKNIQIFFQKLKDKKTFSEEHLPSNFTRFTDNIYLLLKETTKYRKIFEINYVDKILSEFEAFVKSDKIPKSVSVFQIFQLFLFLNDKFVKRETTYTHVITKEMLDIYPELNKKIRDFNKYIF